MTTSWPALTPSTMATKSPRASPEPHELLARDSWPACRRGSRERARLRRFLSSTTKTESPYDACTTAVAGPRRPFPFSGSTTDTLTNIPGRSFSSLLGTVARSLRVRVVASTVGSMATRLPSAEIPVPPAVAGATVILTGMPTETVSTCCCGKVKSTKTESIASSSAEHRAGVQVLPHVDVPDAETAGEGCAHDLAIDLRLQGGDVGARGLERRLVGVELRLRDGVVLDERARAADVDRCQILARFDRRELRALDRAVELDQHLAGFARWRPTRSGWP